MPRYAMSASISCHIPGSLPDRYLKCSTGTLTEKLLHYIRLYFDTGCAVPAFPFRLTWFCRQLLPLCGNEPFLAFQEHISGILHYLSHNYLTVAQPDQYASDAGWETLPGGRQPFPFFSYLV